MLLDMARLAIMAAQSAESAHREAQARSDATQGALNAILTLRGINPAAWRLKVDVNADRAELIPA